MVTHDPSLEPKQRVRVLAEHGSSVEVDLGVPIKRYFRTGQQMIRMANVYYDESNWESAFILYSKYITIFVEKLPKHPEYKTARNEDIKSIKKNVKSAFPKAEDTKKKLNEKYDEEHKLWLAQEEERRVEEARLQAEQALQIQEEQERRDHQEAAMAEEERRMLEQQERLAIDQQQRELDEQKAALLETKMRQEARDKAMAEQMQAEERRRLEQEREEEGRRRLAGSVATPFAAGAAVAGIGSAAAAGMGPSGGLPPPPSYNAVAQGYGIRPEQVLPTAPLQPSVPKAPMPAVDRSLKVDRSNKPAQMLGIASTTSNRHGLRDLFVPADTMTRFLALAKNNTLQNLETCGILAGKLARDAFTLTHIIVPKQTSTADSCTALNEEDIFDFVDNNDLITLGWIHTHPSQTAFMSSIDLHTHCPYQIMMPEAIAIVCAPKHNETGFFSLTPEYGISFIANCKQKGFHPHPSQPPIYEEGAHCKIRSDSQPIRIADLR